MPARQSTHTLPAVNATTFETSILDLIGVGLAVPPRALTSPPSRSASATPSKPPLSCSGQDLAVARLLIAAAVAMVLRTGP